MTGNSIIKTTFAVSLTGHCLLLGIPGNQLSSTLSDKPQAVTVIMEMEKPHLLPREVVIGNKKRIQPKKVQKQEPRPVSLSESVLVKDNLVEQQPEEKVETDNRVDETMLRYQDVIKQRIQEARKYPRWAKKQGLEGSVVAAFTVLANGETGNISILDKSGYAILDKEAINTIKRAAPFPAIPDNLNLSECRIAVTVLFSLK